MAQSINLVPQTEKKVQQKEQIVRASSILTVFLLIVAIAVSAFYFYRTSTLRREIRNLEDDISEKRSRIESLSEIEVSARNLSARFAALESFFATRNNYSILLDELGKRTPETIVIESFVTGKDNTLNISGLGSDYISIARFINTLTDREHPEANEDLQNLFVTVTLNSVNLDAQTNRAKFFVVVDVDTQLLKEFEPGR